MLCSLGEFGVGDSSVPVGRWVCSMTNVVTDRDKFFLFLQGAFFCDLVLLYLIKKSNFYRGKKYEEVK